MLITFRDNRYNFIAINHLCLIEALDFIFALFPKVKYRLRGCLLAIGSMVIGFLKLNGNFGLSLFVDQVRRYRGQEFVCAY